MLDTKWWLAGALAVLIIGGVQEVLEGVETLHVLECGALWTP